MIAYINSILPKIKEYSESLDRRALLVEQPWVLIDKELNYQKFIFKKNNELLMSQNGIVTTGKWEYIPGAKSLLIDRIKDKILLNQEFVDKGLIILKYDGFDNNYFCLVNENIVPDLNIERYFKSIFYQRFNIAPIPLESNDTLEVIRQSPKDIVALFGQKVLLNCQPIDEGVFQSSKSQMKYYIKNGRIVKKSKTQMVKTKDGLYLHIESFLNSVYYDVKIKFNRGDIVRIDNDYAPDGTYVLITNKKIKVQNGVIN